MTSVVHKCFNKLNKYLKGYQTEIICCHEEEEEEMDVCARTGWMLVSGIDRWVGKVNLKKCERMGAVSLFRSNFGKLAAFWGFCWTENCSSNE